MVVLTCGKPAGYIQDFKSLPEKMQDFLKQIKRVRVLFGTIELDNPVDETGHQFLYRGYTIHMGS